MAELKTNEKNTLFRMSPMLYGVFFEDINYGGDGGLYGEMIANRSFEFYDRIGEKDKHKMCWESTGGGDFLVTDKYPFNSVQQHCAVINGGIRNTGFCGEGFSVKDGESLDFMFYAASDSCGEVGIRISDSVGKCIAAGSVEVNSSEWKKYELKLKASDSEKHAFLEIIPSDGMEMRIAFTSLFSEDTYKGRKNGMRKDLAEMVAALKPAFMRFPGGCIVEGRSFENMYCWKDTVGSIEERRTNWNRWQMEEYQQNGRNSEDYFQSYGIGFYEYFQFCEDIGAKPIPVINCGMTCQWHEGLLVDTNKLDRWIKDAEDLIEFANGGADTKWGRVRAEMGHKEPFGLEYIGIGNEQWGSEYFERYELFYERLSKTHPEIKLITSAGWTDCGKEFDLAMDWMRANRNKAYAVDEHFYKTPEWFLDNISRYDSYDRTLPKVFIGEYAAHTSPDVPERRCNWECALYEAAFLTGVERNSDHVIMTSYAPLFARENHQQWQPDMIWFDNDRVYGTPSYYVQKVFSECSGGTIVDVLSFCNDVKVSANIKDDGELIIKAVNISGEDKDFTVKTENKYKSCKITEIVSDLDAENSFESPENVSPVEYSVSPESRIRIKPYSVNVIRLISE